MLRRRSRFLPSWAVPPVRASPVSSFMLYLWFLLAFVLLFSLPFAVYHSTRGGHVPSHV